ncbi:MAG: hypothetical protein HQL57_09870, partial [Magnetococcales bacterium]|nr:hypothetical protein [Magnetococcales bacterium]
ELAEELPGIRLINNNTRVKRYGLGALLLDGKGRVETINFPAMQRIGSEESYRLHLAKLLGTDKEDRLIALQASGVPIYRGLMNPRPRLVQAA